ncbi:MAG: phosphoribosylaminoimidazolesuccinocarboxamide synthase [Phycisphaerales bacterium]
MNAVFQSELALPSRRQGKVRDMYEVPPDRCPAGWGLEGGGLLMVASDRISAFDVVMPTPVAGKGRLLTEISLRWFELIRQRGLARTHLTPMSITGIAGIRGLSPSDIAMLEGRSMLVRRCRVIPIECVVRGYLDGSGWGEYQQSGSVCGVHLPSGLRRGDRLPEPIFTPATKEEGGRHDENISFDRASQLVGAAVMEPLRAISLRVYTMAHAYAAERGVILADTKFEFGFADGEREGADQAEPLLVDEVLTPDSSRYWDAAKWKPGGEQPSFDKQFLREYLNGLVAAGRWNKQAPGPSLPPEVVAGTLARYELARERLFGASTGRA